MVSAVLADRKKWMESLAIDPVTGLDPVGYKVRAAQGLDAASEFIQGYWVWQVSPDLTLVNMILIHRTP
jgi:phospholipid:diacylglycerol acyltransferase